MHKPIAVKVAAATPKNFLSCKPFAKFMRAKKQASIFCTPFQAWDSPTFDDCEFAPKRSASPLVLRLF